MHIGITGGTGFLGRHLATRLLARGDSVTVFSRSPRPDRIAGGASAVAWDPLADPAPPQTLDTLDAVVHLLGEPVLGIWTPAKKRRIRESRVVSTRNLAAGWRQAANPPGVLLSGSAIGFYGDGADRELTEMSPRGDGFLAELSEEWEGAAGPAQDLGSRVVYLRTALPLDPSGGFLAALLPSFKLGLGAVLGSGKQWVPWLHMEDWLALTLFALDDDAVRGPLNLTAPNPVTNRDLTKTLARVLGRPAFLRVPAWVLKVGLGELSQEPLRSQRLLPEKALGLGFRFAFAEMEPALRDLLT